MKQIKNGADQTVQMCRMICGIADNTNKKDNCYGGSMDKYVSINTL